MNIFKIIRWQWIKYIAIKTAIRAHEADGRKYYVLNLEGKPTVVAKSELRKWKARGAFKKGVKIQDFDKVALFISK